MPITLVARIDTLAPILQLCPRRGYFSYVETAQRSVVCGGCIAELHGCLGRKKRTGRWGRTYTSGFDCPLAEPAGCVFTKPLLWVWRQTTSAHRRLRVCERGSRGNQP